jgi:NADPH:quinone reductase-like Zn-dependent oxidoreductase
MKPSLRPVFPPVRGLVVARAAPGHVELRDDVPEPDPTPHEAVLAARAVSINRAEVLGLPQAADGARPGWDAAGDVVQAAADGTGPKAGGRAVGLSPGGAWAERVAVSTDLLAAIPDELSYEAAATLPVAGLTAWHTLLVARLEDDSRVLVTGAAGGVGRFAVQLASHTGATVTAVVGRPDRARNLRELGATDVTIGMPAEGPFDIVLESVGGDSLEAAVRLAAARACIVSFGNSSGRSAALDPTVLYRKAATLRGFSLFDELERVRTGAADLARLAVMAATGRLDVGVGLVASWRDARSAIAALLERRVEGKAVLLID